MVIAVDFDGTLVENCFPNIGNPLMGFAGIFLYEELILMRQNGHKVILWTCRCGDDLKNAVKWCSDRGLEFDAVNDDLSENKQRFKEGLTWWEKSGKARKIFADVYIDDKAINNVSHSPLKESLVGLCKII